MAYAKRPQNAETAATKQSRKRAIKSNQRAVLLVVARKQEHSSSREGRGDGRAAEKEAEENFKGVSFMGALPLDLAMEVLRRLPLRSLVQMRTLSSSFNTLLRAPPKTLRLCRQPPWLVTVRAAAAGPGPDLRTPRELAAYCPLSGTWFPFPPMSEGLLSAMGGPGLLQVLSIFSGGTGPLLSRLAMASAGGLMCAVVTALRPEAERQQVPLPCYVPDVDGYLSRHVFKLKDFYLLVFNVFTGASERLPPPPPALLSREPFQGNEVSVHMFLDTSASGAYYVVLRSVYGLFCTSLCIYSSRTGCWRVGHAGSDWPSPCTFGDIQKCDMLSYDWLYGTDALLAYSVRSDAWLSMPVPLGAVGMPGDWDKVFKWQGRVFLARKRKGGTSFELSVLTSASRWSDTARWVEVARTPSSLVQPFPMDMDAYDVGFVVCGDLVCMSVCMSVVGMSANIGYHNTYLQPLVYDLAGDSWYLLAPPCIEGNKSTGFGVGLLAFQPDLQATP